jgi:hypothetical protein
MRFAASEPNQEQTDDLRILYNPARPTWDHAEKMYESVLKHFEQNSLYYTFSLSLQY